jgi:hypothetical protein
MAILVARNASEATMVPAVGSVGVWSQVVGFMFAHLAVAEKTFSHWFILYSNTINFVLSM